ncbi:MAG: hypothetical protein E7579_04320 [Ruminococcaceae bacterium]|nr:hypothetical protein [Oscillospiraceae bacterium]
MKIIKKLVKMIDEELADAKKYAECALKMREEYPMLANVFYNLSMEEMKHMNMLHAEVVKVIEAYKKEKGEPPAAMLAIWEYKHEEHIEAAEEVSVMQAMFKKV